MYHGNGAMVYYENSWNMLSIFQQKRDFMGFMIDRWFMIAKLVDITPVTMGYDTYSI